MNTPFLFSGRHHLTILSLVVLGAFCLHHRATGQTSETPAKREISSIEQSTLSPTPPPGIPLGKERRSRAKQEAPCPDTLTTAAPQDSIRISSPQRPSAPAAAANREASVRELPLTSPLPPSAKRATKRDEKCGNESEISYIPVITGVIKAKFEVSTFDGKYRFNIRNAQLGAMGNVSPNMFYRLYVDFNNEGKVSVLDSYVGYRTGGFDVRLGQQHHYFSSDLARGPGQNMFSNRSFLAKYLTCYTGGTLSDGVIVPSLSSLGSRDIGIMGTYTFSKRIPLKLFLGLFNGSGCNNPTWNNTINVMGRFELGGAQGFRLAGAYLNGNTPIHPGVSDISGILQPIQLSQKLRMMDVELRYIRNNLFVEGEYARRYLSDESNDDDVLTAALIQSYYRFMMPQRASVTYIAPTLRWDMGNGIDYLNTTLKQLEKFDANRITVGINFGFGKRLVRSEIRFNYEKYILKNRPSDFATNKLLQDKFTVEVVAAF